MFDPVILTHQEAIDRLVRTVGRIDKRHAANAFVASLASRRLDWRSALGSYAIFQHVRTHTPRVLGHRCTYCGFYTSDEERDLNVLNFERHKWGGVRHDHVEYALLDLEAFVNSEPPTPNGEDIQVFRSLVRVISSVDRRVTSAQLQSHLAGVMKSNKAERDVLIAILGFCGVFGIPAHPGYSDAFVPADERVLPDRHFVDMPYPACWWTGNVGLNRSRLLEYFSHVLPDEA